ncbi:Dihydrolipoyllysine-residue acetyltransferase component of pyruvate dehydrogenase complex [bioreactor metagenome]|uniref:Dihydrolipoyllysine-residue acetyltransferase component of pyruvate dehydrogenase complex n=1 Tax=bioreactor metagenome TaxID=1076179 RepID=A0A645FIH9_9ZZZZ
MAGELGVDLAALGTAGRVMKADVLAAAGAASAPAVAAAAPVPGSNDETPKKVNPLRRSIAANMSSSWHTSPRVTFTYAVDATAMKELRDRLKDGLKEKGIKLSYNHILMKVVAKALTEFPDVNSSFADNLLTHHTHVNMGLAVAKGDGLIVPNVKGCENKSLAEIAQETEALIEATRTGKIALEDMTGGTFTISSLGPYGVRNFSPIINQPELAILGVCDMVETPVVRNGQIVIRTMMNLCLTADHRVVDGVMACKFMKRVVELLENPYLLLA